MGRENQNAGWRPPTREELEAERRERELRGLMAAPGMPYEDPGTPFRVPPRTRRTKRRPTGAD